MKVLIQWVRSDPRGWQEIDSAEWLGLASKNEPTGIETIDSAPGWINAVCVQGVVFASFDHYAIEEQGGGVIVTAWNDDAGDWGAGELYARRVLFPPLRADPSLGGAINTAQEAAVFAQRSMARVIGGHPNPWGAFALPPLALTKHGIWIEDPLFAAHKAAVAARGWREWTESLFDAEIAGGLVRNQRRAGRYPVPDGTKTYYWSDTVDPTPIHSADHETALLATTGSATTLTASIRKGSDELTHTARTQASQPDSAAWPTGDYRVQLDVTAAGADLTYGLLTRGGSAGHFARINGAGDTEIETKDQQESAFSGTGLRLATTGSVSWSSGSAGDRFETTIACQNTNTKDNQDLVLQVNELDDYADGAWAAAASRRISIT